MRIMAWEKTKYAWISRNIYLNSIIKNKEKQLISNQIIWTVASTSNILHISKVIYWEEIYIDI